MKWQFAGVLPFLLLPLTVVAQTNPGSGTFAVRPGIPTMNLQPPTPWSDSTLYLQNPSGFTNLTPSGSDDTAAINTALVTSNKGVFVSGGAFLTCSQVVVPRNKALVGPGVGMYFSGNGAQPYPWPGTTLYCPNNGTFANGGAIVKLHDNTLLQGFSITGNRQVAGHNQINCVDSDNSQGPTIREMVLSDCYIAVSRNGDGNKPGDQGTIPFAGKYINNTFWFAENCMICSAVVNGGTGASEDQMWNNEFEVPFGIAISITGGLGYSIENNRFEDGGIGIFFSGVAHFIIQGNFYNRISAIQFNGAPSHGVIANETGSGVEPCCSQYFIQLYGGSDDLRIGPNSCRYNYVSCYTADSSLTNSQIYDSIDTVGLSPLFDGPNTRRRLFPSFMAKSDPYITVPFNTTVAADFSYPNASVSYNSIFYLEHAGCAAAACLIRNFNSAADGTGSRNVVDAKSGVYQIVQSPAGSDIPSWGSAFCQNATGCSNPTLSTGAYATDYIPFVIAGNSTIPGPKVSVPWTGNLITGGNPVVAANWPVTGTVLTTGLAADPIGTSTNTQMVENAASSAHLISQATNLVAGNNVLCAWVKNGAGTRAVSLGFSGSGKAVEMVFTPSTGVINTSAANGSGANGTITSAFTAGTGNGSTRYCLSALLNGGTVPALEYVQMNNGTTPFPAAYTGDNGVSQIDVWGITARAGTLP